MSTRGASISSEAEAGRQRQQALEPHYQAVITTNRFRCECGSIARGAPNDDLRCNHCLSPNDYRHGRTLCSRCRPPDCVFYSRGRRTAAYIATIIQEQHVRFDPPWTFEATRRRQVGILCLTCAPFCTCPCATCSPRNVPPRDDRVILHEALRNPQLEHDDRTAAQQDVAIMQAAQGLGYPQWSLPSWVPEGRLEEWGAALRRELTTFAQAQGLEPPP